MSFTGNGITNCYPDQVDNLISITVLSIYKTNLERLFGQRFLSTSRRLKTSTGSPLFEFMFCVGNPRGIGPATSIAGHILDHM